MITALLERFPESPASYRRMAASVLNSLTSHSKSPETHSHWLVGKMMSKQHSAYVCVCSGGECVVILTHSVQLWVSMRTQQNNHAKEFC